MTIVINMCQKSQITKAVKIYSVLTYMFSVHLAILNFQMLHRPLFKIMDAEANNGRWSVHVR